MFHEIYKLGKEKFQGTDIATKMYDVRWEINLDANGNLNGDIKDWLIITQNEKTKKYVYEYKPMLCPFLNVSNKTLNYCGFLVEYVKKIFGTDKEDTKKIFVATSYNAFIFRIEKSLPFLSEQSKTEMNSILLFLKNPDNMKKAYDYILTNNGKLTDFVVFSVNGNYSHSNTDVLNYWRNVLSDERNKDAKNKKLTISSITGELIKPMKSFPPIKLLKYVSKPSYLISFKRTAFQSYGLPKGENCSMSLEEATIINKTYEFLIKNGIEFDDKVFVSWLGKTPNKICELINNGNKVDALFDRVKVKQSADILNNKDANTMINSPVEGNEIVSQGISDFFYIQVLKLNGSRVIIEHSYKMLAAQIKNNVNLWFDAISTYTPTSDSVKGDISINYLLTAVLPKKQDGTVIWKKLKAYPNVRTELLNCALMNTKVPFYIESLVLANLESSLNNNRDLASMVPNLSLMKLILNKNYNTKYDVMLNENKSTAYVIGQIMAVCEKLQDIATYGKLNRSFIKASLIRCRKCPSEVIPTIMDKIVSYQYYKKANMACKGAGTFKQNELTELFSHLKEIPDNFSRKEQNEYYLGYMQRLNEYNRRKPLLKIEKQETQTEIAPA